MKYKVGDKIKVRSDLIVGQEYCDVFFIEEMKEYKGKEVTINSINYDIKEDNSLCCWTEEMFENEDCNNLEWIKVDNDQIKGVILQSDLSYQKIVKINPIEKHYGISYIKYTCPICNLMGNSHQVTKNQTNCELCGVNLNWKDI